MKMARAITLAHVGHGGFPRKAADMRKLVLDVAGYDEEFVTLPCRFSGTGEAWRTISPLVDAWGPDDVEDSDLALPVRDGDPALDDMCIPAWMWQEGLPERHRKLYEHRLVLFKTAFLDDEGPVSSNGRLFRAMVAPDIPVLTERDADGNVSTKWAGVLLGPSSYLPGSVPGDHVLFAGPVYETGEGEKGNKGEK